MFLSILCSIKIEQLLFLKFLKNLAFLTAIFGHSTRLMKKSMPFLWSVVQWWLQSELFLSNSVDMMKNLLMSFILFVFRLLLLGFFVCICYETKATKQTKRQYKIHLGRLHMYLIFDVWRTTHCYTYRTYAFLKQFLSYFFKQEYVYIIFIVTTDNEL